MQYEARLTAANGAFHTFEFEADMACLAVAHLIHVSKDPSMLKMIVSKMEYRRLYKNGGYSNWRVA